MISIHERHEEVEDRIITGYWESDLIIGKDHKTTMGKIVERTTRSVILVPLKSRDAETVRKAFTKELKTLPQKMTLSMTYDRGKEMSQYKLFTQETKMQVYFCDPHSTCQRGTNENTNMLKRDFFYKQSDFNKFTRKKIKHVQNS
jgi:IS30 family transposase